MNDYAAITAPGTLEIQRILPAPVERVWAFLTESDKRGRWLAAGDMDLRAGADVHLHFDHTELSPHEEQIPERYKSMESGHDSIGRIIECVPPRRLSFTWDESDAEPSQVSFDLSARGDDVLLVVTHRRLADRAAMLSVAGGWHMHLDILADNLNGEVPRPFWATHAKMETQYTRRLAP